MFYNYGRGVAAHPKNLPIEFLRGELSPPVNSHPQLASVPGLLLGVAFVFFCAASGICFALSLVASGWISSSIALVSFGLGLWSEYRCRMVSIQGLTNRHLAKGMARD